MLTEVLWRCSTVNIEFEYLNNVPQHILLNMLAMISSQTANFDYDEETLFKRADYVYLMTDSDTNEYLALLFVQDQDTVYYVEFSYAFEEGMSYGYVLRLIALLHAHLMGFDSTASETVSDAGFHTAKKLHMDMMINAYPYFVSARQEFRPEFVQDLKRDLIRAINRMEAKRKTSSSHETCTQEMLDRVM